MSSTIEMIDQTIGLHNVPVIHANDSKIALGGRVDRHEHVGKGKIGAEAFRRILTHPRLGASYPDGVPGRAFIAETPIEDPGDDRKNVAALWELAGLSEKAPAVEKGYSMLTAAAKKKAAELKKKAGKKTKKKQGLENRIIFFAFVSFCSVLFSVLSVFSVVQNSENIHGQCDPLSVGVDSQCLPARGADRGHACQPAGHAAQTAV